MPESMQGLRAVFLLMAMVLSISLAGAQCPTGAAGDTFCQGKTGQFYADTCDCTKFVQCSNGVTYLQSCGPGTVWNQASLGCVAGSCSTTPTPVPPPATPTPVSPPKTPSPTPRATTTPTSPSTPTTTCARGTTTQGGACGTNGGMCCPSGQCCSQYGYCGNAGNAAYCGSGCQASYGACTGSPTGSTPPTVPSSPSPSPSSASPPSSAGGVAAYLSQSTFSSLFPLIDPSTGNSACTGKGFFTYSSFVTAANAFPSFLHNGDATKDKRELAAFLGQASQETNGAAVGQYNGGLCFVEEGGSTPTTLSYCSSSAQYPCNPSVSYHGRGPLQLSYNFNYEPAGAAVGFDGQNNPMAVSSNAVTSWQASLWFWTTAAGGKPSCHDVMSGAWVPSSSDTAAGRVSGTYGMVTNIINGGVLGCGNGQQPRSAAEVQKIGYYQHYCDVLGVSYGTGVDCATMRSY